MLFPCVSLQEGDYLDAEDNELKWYDSRVAKVYPAGSMDAELPAHLMDIEEDTLKIHFMGWSSRFDIIFKRSSPKLAPLFSKVPVWRKFRVGDKIEMRVDYSWYAVKVKEVDRVAGKIRVWPTDATQGPLLGDKWMDFLRCVRWCVNRQMFRRECATESYKLMYRVDVCVFVQ